jgi:tyrosinase
MCRYWDWTLDSQDLSASPIWSSFGGDGDPSSPIILHNGRCILDGPFANSTRHWQSEKIDGSFQTLGNPRCLSRGFASGEDQKSFQDRVTPSWMNELLRQKLYTNFIELLEASAHNAIPQFINGDFFALSAPNGRVSLSYLD